MTSQVVKVVTPRGSVQGVAILTNQVGGVIVKAHTHRAHTLAHTCVCCWGVDDRVCVVGEEWWERAGGRRPHQPGGWRHVKAHTHRPPTIGGAIMKHPNHVYRFEYNWKS